MMIMYFHIISFVVITKPVFFITKNKWETIWIGAIPEFGFMTGLIGILIPLLLDSCLTRLVSLLKDKKIKFKVGG